MLDVPRDRFDALVSDAIDAIPEPLFAVMSNVAIVVEEDSPAGEPPLFGLYRGIPLTERTSAYAGALPDRISIYRLPILRYCHTEEQVVRQVTITVVHEIAHHFGIDDDHLHELGWG